jgi:hypothetical protein
VGGGGGVAVTYSCSVDRLLVASFTRCVVYVCIYRVYNASFMYLFTCLYISWLEHCSFIYLFINLFIPVFHVYIICLRYNGGVGYYRTVRSNRCRFQRSFT